MSDFYLRFDSEGQSAYFLYTLQEEVIIEADEKIVILVPDLTKPLFANIDTIGVIYENQPTPDPENPPEPVPMEGWHVNVRLIGEDGSALEPFKVEPEHPRRVWG